MKFMHPKTLPDSNGYYTELEDPSGKNNVKFKFFLRSKEDDFNELIVGIYENDYLKYKFGEVMGEIKKPGGLTYMIEDDDTVLVLNVENSEKENLVVALRARKKTLEMVLYDADTNTENQLYSMVLV